MTTLAEGWIKLHRKICNCTLWQDKPYDKARAWIDLLLMVMHKDTTLHIDNENIVVSRGSYMTSTLKLAERWGWSRNKVVRFLDLLESENMLTTVRTKRGTIISIIKYEDYQLEETSKKTEETKKKTTNSNSSNDKANLEELEKNFKIIYESYPKKVGKARGFELYRQWLKGRDISGRKIKLTNKQIWNAIARYKLQQEKNNAELQYYKNFDVFMNKAILDYVEEEQ